MITPRCNKCSKKACVLLYTCEIQHTSFYNWGKPQDVYFYYCDEGHFNNARLEHPYDPRVFVQSGTSLNQLNNIVWTTSGSSYQLQQQQNLAAQHLNQQIQYQQQRILNGQSYNYPLQNIQSGLYSGSTTNSNDTQISQTGQCSNSKTFLQKITGIFK